MNVESGALHQASAAASSRSGVAAGSQVVFVLPSPRMLRAGATWVVLRNWMEGARRKWGQTVVVTPDGLLSHADVLAATRTTSKHGPQSRGPLATLAETAAKDMRSFIRMHRFSSVVRRSSAGLDPLFVWQHHDLFNRAGFEIARMHHRSVVLLVEACAVWEARKWGVRRPGWGKIVEALGESPQLRRADLVVCVSDEVASAAIALGAEPERVMVLPNTADAVRSVAPRPELRPSLGLDDCTVIGWVGSFRPFHHAHRLVEAVARLQREHNVALLMVGDGPTLGRCKQLSRDLGLRRAVFPGSVSHDDAIGYLYAIDIGVIPAGSDDAEFHYSPLKLKEFLAAGKAVIAPRVGEMARLLRDGVELLLYDPSDAGALDSAIDSLLSDPGLRRSLAQRGREAYDRLFSMDRQLNAVEAALGLDRPGGASA